MTSITEMWLPDSLRNHANRCFCRQVQACVHTLQHCVIDQHVIQPPSICNSQLIICMVLQVSHISPHLQQEHLRLFLRPTICPREGSQAERRSSLQQTLHLKCAYELHPLILGPWRSWHLVTDFCHILESCFLQVCLEVIGFAKRPAGQS
jgi:hypothetical protein